MKKRNVFIVLACFMIGFGILIGILFPFFVLFATSVQPNELLNIKFFSITIAFGVLVGFFNLLIARKIVGNRVEKFSKHIKKVEDGLKNKAESKNFLGYIDEGYFITEITPDEIGRSGQSFNSLLNTLSHSFKTELEVKEFTELLSNKLELDVLSVSALKKLLDKLNASAGAVLVEKEGVIEVLTSYALVKPKSLKENKVIKDVFKTQKSMVINNPEEVFKTEILFNVNPECVILEPIIYKNVMIGLILLTSLDNFEEDKKRLLKQYGQGLALAFKNAIEHSKLQIIASNDPLTGSLNRRFGMERLKEEYVTAVQTKQPLGLLIMDIDNFKKINDTYGHLVGDKVLVAINNIAKESLREGDIFFRYGGEEFIAILPGASVKDLKTVSEKLRRLTEELEVEHNEKMIKVTMSIGGVSLPEKSVESYIALIEIADINLYKAKESGKNKVVLN